MPVVPGGRELEYGTHLVHDRQLKRISLLEGELR